MARTRNQQDDAGLSDLAQGILGDVEKLVSQHLELFRSEVKQELGEARQAAVSLLAGAGAAAAGGILGLLALVHLLHRTTGLPLWACHALVGASLGMLGTGLITTGVKQAADVSLVPQQTAEEVRQELAGVRG